MAHTEQERLSLDGLISRRQIRKLIDVSDMTLWRWEQAGTFPRHLTINGRNYWRRSDVLAWLDRQGTSAGADDGGARYVHSD
jgi:prophage regulatory protein